MLLILLLLLPIFGCSAPNPKADGTKCAPHHLEVRSKSWPDTVLVETCVEDFGDSLKITKNYEIIETTERWYVEVYFDGFEVPSCETYGYYSYPDQKYKPWERFLQNYKTIQWKRVKR